MVDLELGRRRIAGGLCVVVGGTSGIGLAACEGLQKMGARLVLGALNCKEKQRAIQHLGKDIEVLPLDLRSRESISGFVAALKGRRVDVFVSSAGVCSTNQLMIQGLVSLKNN